MKSPDWACPADGLYESFDFRNYFEDANKRAFLIRINSELAGFVLLNQEGLYSDTVWNMGEFFILARFQKRGIGQLVSSKIWTMYPGIWEVSVIPENRSGLSFWKKTITGHTAGQFTEKIEKVDYDFCQPKRIIFQFDTQK